MVALLNFFFSSYPVFGVTFPVTGQSWRASSVPSSRETSGSRASASNGLPQERRSCSEWTARGSNSFKRNCIWSLGICWPSGKIERTKRGWYILPSASFLRVVGINFIRWNFQYILDSFFRHFRRFDFLRGFFLSDQTRFADSIIGNLLRFLFDTAQEKGKVENIGATIGVNEPRMIIPFFREISLYFQQTTLSRILTRLPRRSIIKYREFIH